MSESIRANKHGGVPGRPTGVTTQKGVPARGANSKKQEESASSGKKHWWWLAGVFLLLGTLAVFAWSRSGPAPSPQMAKVKDMAKELFSNNQNLSPEDRRAKFQEFREEEKQLTDAERKTFREERFKEGQKRQAEEAANYVKMAPQEKTEYLDKKIKEWEQRRQQFAGLFGQGGNPGGPGGQGGGPGGRQGGQTGQAGGTQAGQAGTQTGTAEANQAGGQGQNPPSADDRQAFRRMMLDSTTPDQRGQMDQFRSDMSARRQQLGYPATGRGPR